MVHPPGLVLDAIDLNEAKLDFWPILGQDLPKHLHDAWLVASNDKRVSVAEDAVCISRFVDVFEDTTQQVCCVDAASARNDVMPVECVCV